MFLPLSVMVVASPLIIGVADRIPTFDINPTCGTDGRTAARGGIAAGDRTAASRQDAAGGRDTSERAGIGERGSDACLRSEKAAREELAKRWAEFPAADRSRCAQLATMTQLPSYVQVITCLEMAQQARQLGSSRTTTGTVPQDGAAPQR